jgi:hypothetical protein
MAQNPGRKPRRGDDVEEFVAKCCMGSGRAVAQNVHGWSPGIKHRALPLALRDKFRTSGPVWLAVHPAFTYHNRANHRE